jgi:hypothetical protein
MNCAVSKAISYRGSKWQQTNKHQKHHVKHIHPSNKTRKQSQTPSFPSPERKRTRPELLSPGAGSDHSLSARHRS